MSFVVGCEAVTGSGVGSVAVCGKMPPPTPPAQEFAPLGPTLVFQSGGGKLCLQPFALGLEASQLGSVAVLFSGGLDLSDFQLHLLELEIKEDKKLTRGHPTTQLK